MYSQDEIRFWIAGATGDAGTGVEPGVCASIARAMIDYNKTYGDIRGAVVDKDKRFLLEDVGQFITEKQLAQLENSYSEEDEKYLEEFEKECEEITRQDIEWQKNEIRRLENKIHNMKIIIIMFGLGLFALIANILINLV